MKRVNCSVLALMTIMLTAAAAYAGNSDFFEKPVNIGFGYKCTAMGAITLHGAELLKQGHYVSFSNQEPNEAEMQSGNFAFMFGVKFEISDFNDLIDTEGQKVVNIKQQIIQEQVLKEADVNGDKLIDNMEASQYFRYHKMVLLEPETYLNNPAIQNNFEDQ